VHLWCLRAFSGHSMSSHSHPCIRQSGQPSCGACSWECPWGLTAIAIIYSPWGKQSGAHINPSVTFTFFRLGKIKFWDALFYMIAQFTGAVLGVLLVARFLRKEISDPAVRYVVTLPGPHGPWVALLSEFIIAAGMMSAVLYFSNHHRLANYTGLFAGMLVATYISLEAPFSGMSMNPARTFGSAFPPMIWDGLWIYLTAQPGYAGCRRVLFVAEGTDGGEVLQTPPQQRQTLHLLRS
jgi:glycerol uptake facilitator-like aquaporin